MKYMAIIYGNKALWESFPAEVIGEAIASVNAFNKQSGHHRLLAVRGHLLEMARDAEQAAISFETAARLTASVPEKRYLDSRASSLRSISRSNPD